VYGGCQTSVCWMGNDARARRYCTYGSIQDIEPIHPKTNINNPPITPRPRSRQRPRPNSSNNNETRAHHVPPGVPSPGDAPNPPQPSRPAHRAEKTTCNKPPPPRAPSPASRTNAAPSPRLPDARARCCAVCGALCCAVLCFPTVPRTRAAEARRAFCRRATDVRQTGPAWVVRGRGVGDGEG
jgi:hypothetical protein